MASTAPPPLSPSKQRELSEILEQEVGFDRMQPGRQSTLHAVLAGQGH